MYFVMKLIFRDLKNILKFLSCIADRQMQKMIGRGRSRMRNSTPSPPPSLPGTQNTEQPSIGRSTMTSFDPRYGCVRPVFYKTGNSFLPGKENVTSFGRGQPRARFAAAQVSTIVSGTENMSVSDREGRY